MSRPLAVDLCTGLHGWAEGLIAEGWRVRGYDIEDMCAAFGQPRPSHVELVLKSILDLHGSECADADLIVASPPCQFFSYTAMPWARARALAAKVRADQALLKKELALFDACFRIQREACEAAGRHIPMVVENVRGAIPWVGRSRWNFGSFHLWGDVPALMPIAKAIKVSTMGAGWYPPGHPKHVKGLGFNTHAYRHVKGQNPDGRKIPERIVHVRDGAPHTKHLTNPEEHQLLLRKDGKPHMHQLLEAREGAKSVGSGPAWWRQGPGGMPSKSIARKFASAMIARIPLPLSRHIAATYRPAEAKTA